MEKSKDQLPLPNEGEGRFSSSIISLKDLNWIDHTVQIVYIGESTVRVESDRPIDPGFVWFNDRVRGHKGGILIWSQKFDARYRALIRLVPLTREEERNIQERTVLSGAHRPHRSPEEIIATLSQSLRRNST